MTKEEILNNKKMKRFTKDETAHITKAMQEYADLRCKELQEEVERLKEEYNKLYRRFMDSLPDSDY